MALYGVLAIPFGKPPLILVLLCSPNAPFEIIVKDACGAIKKAWVTLYSTPSVGQDVQLSDFACFSFTATVVDVVNLISPSFCLYDSANVLLGCNSTGVFSNLPYGSYCIQVKDSCTDSTFNRCFTASHPASSIDQAVDIRDRACSTFTAVITGQQNIFIPEYCLYTESDSLITCNATGVFTDLPYGRYCIKLTDRCTDTTITRCFEAFRPLPSLGGFSQYYLNCTTVTLTVNGDSSYHSQYCLYDTAGVLIACNSTGIFDSIPIGYYCATMYDACYDTTITYCASIPGPVLENDLSIRVRSRTCTSFTLLASSYQVDGEYCLYDSSGTLIGCDSTGVFTNLPYGYYCVTGTISCPDTTFRTCINVERPEPSVNSTIRTSDLTCSTFTAFVTGQQNLTNPNYCLYDEYDTLIACNTTGVFNNLTYGSYCIKITDGCVDTTIVNCFTRYPTPVSLQGVPGKSCALGFSTFYLTFNGTNPPYNVVIYNPDQTVLQTSTYTNNNAYFDGIPGLPDSLMYTVVVADACGNSDTISLAAPFGFYRRNFTVLNKCPGATWASGSGNITGTISTNMGTMEAQIISKDGVYLSPAINPTSNNGVQVSFNDLGPGVYVVKNWENTCQRPYYDTVTIRPYQFPSLDNSSAFQCDFGGFSLSAFVTNGVGPYTYEIIGSTPSTPSIIAGPQASPLFSINNGSMYSLIRLRVTDACGNASLGDASILPLALNGIVVSNDCLMQPTSLTVDNINGATYAWYKKLTATGTDSTFLGNSNSVFIPQVLHSDTGVYVCYLSVNSGCIRRTYIYNLTGDCHTILPLKLQEFTGHARGTENVLQWKTQLEQDLSHFTVEKKDESGLFKDLGRVKAAGNSQLPKQYEFVDASPVNGKTYYRLKMTDLNGDVSYSNVIAVSNGKKDAIYVYPNPVREQLNISFAVKEKASYSIRLYSGTGQLLSTSRYMAFPGSVYQLKRPAGVQRGNYILQAVDERTGTVHNEKLIFQ